jgi:O-antigen ligase
LPFCQNKKITQYALWAFVGTMGFIWMLGLLKVLGLLSIGSKFSAAAVFKDHIVTSYLMSFAAYILAERAYYHKEYRELSVLVLSLMIFQILFMSAGRTGYVMLMLLSSIFTWQHWRWRGFLVMLPVVAVLLGLAVQCSSTFSDRFFHIPTEWQSYQSGTETSIGLRLEFFKTSFYTALEHPWFGTGTGSFSTAYAKTASVLGLESIRNPHNEYLHIWIEIGVLGCVLLFFLFHRMWQCSRLLTEQEKMIAQGFILSFMLGCLGNSILMDFTERHFFILMTALLFSTVPSPYKDKMTEMRSVEDKKCHTFH